MDWLDYREKLGIGFCDREKFQFLKIYIGNFLNSITERISFSNYFDFCTMTGTVFHSEYNSQFDGNNRFALICKAIEANSTTIESFLAYYMAFINTYRNFVQGESEYNRDDYMGFLLNGLKSSHIPYDIYEENGNYFVFPKGAKEFDDALVSQPLEWLKDYPKTYKTYCIALKQYSEGIYIRDIADNLRKSLEDFLRDFLKNEKDLNGNKKEAEEYLKRFNANPQLINIFGSLLTHYYLLNNDTAKHNDKVDKTYLEFLLYQTGIFIRTLIVVRQEKEEISHAD